MFKKLRYQYCKFMMEVWYGIRLGYSKTGPYASNMSDFIENHHKKWSVKAIEALLDC